MQSWIGLTEVVVPAEPATVASIDVHDDVGQVKAAESISNTLTVTAGRVLAGLLVDVGNKVGKRIGLNDESNGNLGVLLEDGNNGYKGQSGHKEHSEGIILRSMYSVL